MSTLYTYDEVYLVKIEGGRYLLNVNGSAPADLPPHELLAFWRAIGKELKQLSGAKEKAETHQGELDFV